MINASSDPVGTTAMRTVYLRASTQTSAIVPPATDTAPATSPDDGVISLVSRPSATSAMDAQPAKMDEMARQAPVMELFAWQTAQAMLADPMQALSSQRAPLSENVTALIASGA